MKAESMTRKLVKAPDELWVRVTALQLRETARRKKAVPQSDITYRALAIGVDAMERDSDLDAT